MMLLVILVIAAYLIKCIVWWWAAFKLKYGLVLLKIKWWITTAFVCLLLGVIFKWCVLVLFL